MSAALAIVLAFICLAGGGLLGFLFGRGGGSDKKRVEALEQEFEDYKRDVTAHFGKTAEHFQSMGRQYRELYEHMATGATKLCEQDDRTRLAFPSLLTIEAVAENPAEAALDTGSAEAEAAQAPSTETEPTAAETEPTAAEAASTDTEDAVSAEAEASGAAEAPDTDEGETDKETPRESAAASSDDDTTPAAAADETPDRAAGTLSAGDAAEDDLEVEVDVEVVDDEAPEPEDKIVGAKPLAETPDLDPTDDAGATRH